MADSCVDAAIWTGSLGRTQRRQSSMRSRSGCRYQKSFDCSRRAASSHRLAWTGVNARCCHWSWPRRRERSWTRPALLSQLLLHSLFRPVPARGKPASLVSASVRCLRPRIRTSPHIKFLKCCSKSPFRQDFWRRQRNDQVCWQTAWQDSVKISAASVSATTDVDSIVPGTYGVLEFGEASQSHRRSMRQTFQCILSSLGGHVQHF